MANGDNLPYNGSDLDVVPFTPITSEWGDGVGSDLLALAGGTGFDDGAIDTNTLADSAVTAGKIDFTTLTPAYAGITTSATATSTSDLQVDGLSATITANGSQKYKITFYTPGVAHTSADQNVNITLWDGAPGSGTQLQYGVTSGAAGKYMNISLQVIVTPTVGSHTFNVAMGRAGTGTATMFAGSTSPSFLLVEAV